MRRSELLNAVLVVGPTSWLEMILNGELDRAVSIVIGNPKRERGTINLDSVPRSRFGLPGFVQNVVSPLGYRLPALNRL